jgi:outer membrane protein OmpA-like peptidoglycan-associated protein
MRAVRIWAGAAVAAVVLPLGGCSHVPDAINPVAWYHGVTGTSPNTEDVGQANQQNLEAGSKEPYPNLATVPNVPSGATGTAERQKLVDSLIADRANAQYSNERLQAGTQLATIPPPPAAVNLGAASATAPAAPATPAATAPTSAPPTAKRTTQQHEAPPTESSLTSPTIPGRLQGQAPPPPPPPVKVASTPPPAPPSLTPPASPGPPPTLKKPPEPAGVRSGRPTLAMQTPSTVTNPITVSVGDVVFTPGSSDVAETQRSALAEIAGLYKQTGGQIRIIGHAEPGHSTDAVRQRLAALDLALDRANAVAQALAKLGVPARAIQIEAAPASAKAQPRAEVFMEY